MTRLPTLVLLAALMSSLAWIPPAGAQASTGTSSSRSSAAASRPAAMLSLAQAERNAVDLKQGMSAEEVQKLLGTPRRTALKNNGTSRTLQWSYMWTGTSSQGSLHIEFASKTAEQWYVSSWEWASY